jgi:probable HAF family extracellular repeat protein
MGDVAVLLQFSGTASYGADYLVFPEPDAEGHVTIPDGFTTLDLDIIPIPDTRSEMPHETIILTVLEGQQSRPGTPASVTLNLLDDDPVSLPALGWKLTDLGAVSSVGSYANGINTLPDGQGGWRGQVAGLAHNSSSYPNYYSSGFRWNNGSSAYLVPPSGWGFQPWCSAYSINDASTAVGQSAFYYAGVYYSRACYWPAAQGAAVILNPLTTVASLENYALDLNQRDAVNQRGGLIVGHAPYTSSKYHAVVWIPNSAGVYGNAVELFDLAQGEKTSYATAINDYAEVVGRSQTGTGNNYHAFRTRSAPNSGNNNQWEPFGLELQDDMGTATLTDAHTSELNDINGLGEMVGRGHVVGTAHLRALYKAPYSGKDTGWHDLGVLGAGTANAGTESVANAISANGTIAGQSRLKVGSSQVWRAFVLSNAGNPGSQPLVNLNDVTWLWVNNQWVLATSQGWTLVSAERVNRAGWIVGYGTKAGQTRAFVLSPR